MSNHGIFVLGTAVANAFFAEFWMVVASTNPPDIKGLKNLVAAYDALVAYGHEPKVEKFADNFIMVKIPDILETAITTV